MLRLSEDAGCKQHHEQQRKNLVSERHDYMRRWCYYTHTALAEREVV
jgi:hypothetical protein